MLPLMRTIILNSESQNTRANASSTELLAVGRGPRKTPGASRAVDARSGRHVTFAWIHLIVFHQSRIFCPPIGASSSWIKSSNINFL